MGNFNAFQMMNELDDIALRVQVAAALAGVPPCIPDVRRRVAECVRAANPYGCNQYGEGWKLPHNGTSTRYVDDKDGKRHKEVTRADGGGNGGKEATRKESTKEAKARREAAFKATEGLLNNSRFSQDSSRLVRSAAGVHWSDKIKTEEIEEFNKHISEYRKRFPKVQISGLGSRAMSNPTWAAACMNVTWRGQAQANAIHLNDGNGGFRDFVDKESNWTEDKQQRTGFKRWNVGRDMKSLVSHEFGHAVHATAAFGSSSVDAAIRAAYKQAVDTGDIKTLSGYAYSGDGKSRRKAEFFAECFSARENGEKLPDYIEKMLDKVIRAANM